jgi:methyl-accepting chemotaxis protein
MKLQLSMKGRLVALAGFALIGVCALAALAAGASYINKQAITNLYEDDMDALVRLQRIENSLLEVRFRAAGVLLDQLPIPGSLNHVRDARKSIASEWQTLEARAGRSFAEKDAAEAFKQAQEKWNLVDATLGKIEQGYVAKDKAILTTTLEEDWAVMHKGAVKPLQTLIPITVKTSDDRFHQAKAQSDKLLFAGVFAGLVCLIGLAITAWLTGRALFRPLREVEQAMKEIAEGNLAASLPTARRDELGNMIAALAVMQQRLADLVGAVRHSAENIQVASTEVASGNQDLSVRTEQTASNLQHTASSMEQLTSTVKQSADSARQANQLATSAAEVASRGGKVVSDVVVTMEEINTSSKKIADIISVIDGIAFQTNILALNAAVEAARAGEQGRGFAVVASEVRSLAQRSADAAKEIKTLISTSVEKVESGSRLVANAGTTMEEIVNSVQRVTDVISEITAASSEQSQGITQVNSAVSELDQMTQQNAALVEQSAAAAASLKDQAIRLAQVVQAFRLQPAVAIG